MRWCWVVEPFAGVESRHRRHSRRSLSTSPDQAGQPADCSTYPLEHHLHRQASGVSWRVFRNCLKLVFTTGCDYRRHERVENVVPGDDLPEKPGTSPFIYFLGPRLDPLKKAEAFTLSFRFLLPKLHGLAIIQRPETKLRVDFPDLRCRARVTRQHHSIDFSNFRRYRKSLFTNPSPGKTTLDLKSAAVVSR